MLLIALLTGCARGELELNPIGIQWGEIDFQDDACFDCACEDHCGPKEITLTNIGEADLNVELPDGLDPERFCLKGFEDVSEPITIPTLSPEDIYLLELSVCGYLAGEQTLTVVGQFVFHTDGIEETAVIEWSYVPIRDQSGG